MARIVERENFPHANASVHVSNDDDSIIAVISRMDDVVKERYKLVRMDQEISKELLERVNVVGKQVAENDKAFAAILKKRWKRSRIELDRMSDLKKHFADSERLVETINKQADEILEISNKIGELFVSFAEHSTTMDELWTLLLVRNQVNERKQVKQVSETFECDDEDHRASDELVKILDYLAAELKKQVDDAIKLQHQVRKAEDKIPMTLVKHITAKDEQIKSLENQVIVLENSLKVLRQIRTVQELHMTLKKHETTVVEVAKSLSNQVVEIKKQVNDIREFQYRILDLRLLQMDRTISYQSLNVTFQSSPATRTVPWIFQRAMIVLSTSGHGAHSIQSGLFGT